MERELLHLFSLYRRYISRANLDKFIYIHQAHSCCYRDERKPHEPIRHDIVWAKTAKSHPNTSLWFLFVLFYRLSGKYRVLTVRLLLAGRWQTTGIMILLSGHKVVYQIFSMMPQPVRAASGDPWRGKLPHRKKKILWSWSAVSHLMISHLQVGVSGTNRLVSYIPK